MHRLKKREAEARIVEDDLDQDRSADHEPERHRKAGEVGQDRVATRVHEHDPDRREPFRPGHLHVVLGERRDHRVTHRQDPTADRGDHDRKSRKESMPDHLADERPREIDRICQVVGEAEREPAERQRERQQDEQSQPEIRKRRDDDEQRRQDRVENSASSPGAQHAEQRAEDEGDDRRHSDQSKRPGKALLDHVPHRHRKERDGCPEVAGQRVAQVLEVLLKDVLVGLQPERNLDRLDGFRADAAVKANDHRLRRVARHDPRQDEVHRQGGPERDEEKLEPADQIAHFTSLLAGDVGRPLGGRPDWRLTVMHSDLALLVDVEKGDLPVG